MKLNETTPNTTVTFDYFVPSKEGHTMENKVGLRTVVVVEHEPRGIKGQTLCLENGKYRQFKWNQIANLQVA